MCLGSSVAGQVEQEQQMMQARAWEIINAGDKWSCGTPVAKQNVKLVTTATSISTSGHRS